MKKFQVVRGLIFHNDSALLLEKQVFFGGKYDAPGGRIKKHETDEQALNREVIEEIGLGITVERLLNDWVMNIPELQMHIEGKTYLCSTDSDKVTLSKEHFNYKWVERKDLLKQNIPNWLKDAILKI
jgi:8-oxo-dGTP diphosphatase